MVTNGLDIEYFVIYMVRLTFENEQITIPNNG